MVCITNSRSILLDFIVFRACRTHEVITKLVFRRANSSSIIGLGNILYFGLGEYSAQI